MMLHALHYNALYATGGNLWGLTKGVPYLDLTNNYDDHAKEMIRLYSDVVTGFTPGNTTNYHDVLHPSDETYQDKTSDLNMAIRHVTYLHGRPKIVEEDYALEMNRKLNLFGLPFLCWDKYFLKGENGVWTGVRDNSDGTLIMMNPLRREVLAGKALTILKIGAIGAGTWYGLKRGKQYLGY